MNKRTIAVGIVGIGIAIGMYLNGWFQGAGTGSDGSGDQPQVTEDDTTVTRNVMDPDSVATTETSTTTPAESGKVLEVIVGEKGYQLRAADGTTESVELDRLVELAKAASGNDLGIRVRVFQRESSLPPAEIALKEALGEAGLSDRSILWEDKLLE